VDLHKVSLASLAMDLSFAARALCHTDSTDSTDFLHRCARRADAGFLIRLLASLTKSGKSRRFFSLRGFVRVRVRLNLVDFYKVSLASLAMEFFFAGAGLFILLLASLTKSRKSCRLFPFGDCPGAGSIKSRRFL